MGVHVGRNPVSGQGFVHIAPVPFFGVDLEYGEALNDAVIARLERTTNMIDHVTYAVESAEELHGEGIYNFMNELGMYEVDASRDVLEKGWDVRWFKASLSPTIIHFVVKPKDRDYGLVPNWGLNHICVNLPRRRFDALRNSCPGKGWLEHDGGKEVGDPLCRFWLKGPCGIRVEVRPRFLGAIR